MRKEYDFSKLKGRRNPYANTLKKQVTLRLGVDVIEYFKQMARIKQFMICDFTLRIPAEIGIVSPDIV
jgi:hypothetical protein